MFQDNSEAVLYTDFDYELLRLPILDYWLTAGVTDQQGMLTPLRHLIQLLVYQAAGVRVCHAFVFVLLGFLDYEIDYSSLSSSFHFMGNVVWFLLTVLDLYAFPRVYGNFDFSHFIIYNEFVLPYTFKNIYVGHLHY